MSYEACVYAHITPFTLVDSLYIRPVDSGLDILSLDPNQRTALAPAEIS